MNTSNLTTKVNRFIKNISFEADGSVFLTFQQEYEITDEDGSVKKIPFENQRIQLAVDDPKTEEVLGYFAPAIQEYWKVFKSKSGVI